MNPKLMLVGSTLPTHSSYQLYTVCTVTNFGLHVHIGIRYEPLRTWADNNIYVTLADAESMKQAFKLDLHLPGG